MASSELTVIRVSQRFLERFIHAFVAGTCLFAAKSNRPWLDRALRGIIARPSFKFRTLLAILRAQGNRDNLPAATTQSFIELVGFRGRHGEKDESLLDVVFEVHRYATREALRHLGKAYPDHRRFNILSQKIHALRLALFEYLGDLSIEEFLTQLGDAGPIAIMRQAVLRLVSKEFTKAEPRRHANRLTPDGSEGPAWRAACDELRRWCKSRGYNSDVWIDAFGWRYREGATVKDAHELIKERDPNARSVSYGMVAKAFRDAEQAATAEVLS